MQHSTGRALAVIRAPPTPRPFPLISPTCPPPSSSQSSCCGIPNSPAIHSAIQPSCLSISFSPSSLCNSRLGLELSPFTFGILFGLVASQPCTHLSVRAPLKHRHLHRNRLRQLASTLVTTVDSSPPTRSVNSVSLRCRFPVEPSPALNVASPCSPFSSSKLLARALTRPVYLCSLARPIPIHPSPRPSPGPLTPPLVQGRRERFRPGLGLCWHDSCVVLQIAASSPPAAALHQKLPLHPPSPFLFTPHHLVFALSRLTSSSLHSSLHPSTSLAFIHGSHSHYYWVLTIARRPLDLSATTTSLHPTCRPRFIPVSSRYI